MNVARIERPKPNGEIEILFGGAQPETSADPALLRDVEKFISRFVILPKGAQREILKRHMSGSPTYQDLRRLVALRASRFD